MAQSTTPETRINPAGVTVERRLTREGVHPFDEVEWELRDAIIGDPENPAFEQRGVEFPRSWSQNATNIVAQKYFRGQLGSDERETSVKQMIGRVAGTIAGWGREGGYFASDADAEAFEAELTAILLHQEAAFNSPVWFNVGFAREVAALATPAGDRAGDPGDHLLDGGLALIAAELAAEVFLGDDVGRVLRPRPGELDSALFEGRVRRIADHGVTELPLDLVEGVLPFPGQPALDGYSRRVDLGLLGRGLGHLSRSLSGLLTKGNRYSFFARVGVS